MSNRELLTSNPVANLYAPENVVAYLRSIQSGSIGGTQFRRAADELDRLTARLSEYMEELNSARLTCEYWKAEQIAANEVVCRLTAEVAELLRDAERYRRLQVLGCAPYGSKTLQQGLVLRFSSLDKFIDADISLHPSRGEARKALGDSRNA